LSPRPDVSAERRDQILDAAAAVFARMGVHNARMDDIVAEANLSKGGVYWYFKSKEELVAALVERLLALSAANLAQFLEEDRPFAAQMVAVGGYLAGEIGGIGGLRGVVLEYYALAARDAEVRRRVRGYIDEFIRLFETMLRAAVERGECRDLDPRKTAIALEAMCEGLTVLWLVDTTGFQIDDMVAHHIRLMLDALLPRGKSS